MSSPNTVPSKNPLPRDQFREVADNISKHRTLVDDPAFDRAVHFALLQHQVDVTNQIKDMNSSVAAGLKLAGALEFVGILRMLSETPPPMAKMKIPTLDHTV